MKSIYRMNNCSEAESISRANYRCCCSLMTNYPREEDWYSSGRQNLRRQVDTCTPLLALGRRAHVPPKEYIYETDILIMDTCRNFQYMMSPLLLYDSLWCKYRVSESIDRAPWNHKCCQLLMVCGGYRMVWMSRSCRASILVHMTTESWKQFTYLQMSRRLLTFLPFFQNRQDELSLLVIWKLGDFPKIKESSDWPETCTVDIFARRTFHFLSFPLTLIVSPISSNCWL